MSGTEMANDISKAIASGGYAIAPEKAVDGTGRNAIYVYMTYNGQSGYQSWKISGGLNGNLLKALKDKLNSNSHIVANSVITPYVQPLWTRLLDNNCIICGIYT